ncbi:uncharacterized protein CC84DRAFT_1256369 [Paraphaeosphaeria sporulosa]|uniref:Uncharacterized protein n=1 Tax=Paraphaeosphaeria sporulosa TaxID=1460663 RepID=A0A177CU59_9PLEO|nr:uncharacterized protein CC84DRAFT_1256369 [Paraphaeosphaeria sporulosa]OAG10548.1 hypothetical protein CC84DRAFT_1256369 [Paraphaeosphaeria sporulosa]
MVSPSAEKRAAQPKPEPTTAESVTEKQAPNKDKKDPSESTDAYRKFVAANAVITKNKQLAKAPAKAEAEPKTRLEVLYAQHIRAPKRAKAPQVTRKPVLELPKKVGTKAEDLFKQQTDNVDAEDSDAFTDADAQAKEEASKLTACISKGDRDAQLLTIGIDNSAGGASKKRNYKKFEIDEDTDSAKLAKKVMASFVFVDLDFKPKPVPHPHPHAKKMKMAWGKAASPRMTKEKGDMKPEHSDERTEHRARKKPARKTVPRTALDYACGGEDGEECGGGEEAGNEQEPDGGS